MGFYQPSDNSLVRCLHAACPKVYVDVTRALEGYLRVGQLHAGPETKVFDVFFLYILGF